MASACHVGGPSSSLSSGSFAKNAEFFMIIWLYSASNIDAGLAGIIKNLNYRTLQIVTMKYLSEGGPITVSFSVAAC